MRLFQPTRSLEEAVAVVALALAFITVAFITVPFIVVAFIVVQPYAVEWRSALVPLPSALLLMEPMERNAADTIPTQHATNGF